MKILSITQRERINAQIRAAVSIGSAWGEASRGLGTAGFPEFRKPPNRAGVRHTEEAKRKIGAAQRARRARERASSGN